LPAPSWIEPILEFTLQKPEHFFFDALNVREAAPASQVTVLGRTFNLYNELFHQSQLVRVFFPQVLLAKICNLRLPVFGP
jgi:hypothetical protein